MWRAEVRGLLVVIVVGVAIVVLVMKLDTYGEDESSAAPSSTTEAPTTTTTTPLPVEPVDALCARVDELEAEIVDRIFNPVLTPIEEVLFQFFNDVSALDLGAVGAEYRAAAAFYERYNALAGPYGFDPERVVVEAPDDIYLQWRSLVTGDALGIEATSASLGFLCGVSMPVPLTYDIDDIEDLEDDFERERERFQAALGFVSSLPDG